MNQQTTALYVDPPDPDEDARRIPGPDDIPLFDTPETSKETT